MASLPLETQIALEQAVPLKDLLEADFLVQLVKREALKRGNA